MEGLPQDLDALIRSASSRSGSEASLRERERAALVLLSYGERALGRLLEMIAEKPESLEAPRLIELAGRFGRDQSTPLLRRLLFNAADDSARAAARALASVASEGAYEALADALRAEEAAVRIAAVDAVRLTGEGERWCALIEPALLDADANLRYYAVNAAAELGCLDADRLGQIAEQDGDEHVRTLAAGFKGAS